MGKCKCKLSMGDMQHVTIQAYICNLYFSHFTNHLVFTKTIPIPHHTPNLITSKYCLSIYLNCDEEHYLVYLFLDSI